MDLSIIIPVYNTAPKALSECFDSLRLPEGVAFEVIVVDDGSKDETARFCRDYAAAHRDFYCLRQENQGVSAARNTGLSHARGRYVMFVDADDTLIGDAIQGRWLEAGCDLVFFDHEVHEAGRIRQARIFDGVQSGVLKKKEILRAACQDRVNAAWARLYRRTLLLEHGIRFAEDMVVAEDAVFVLAAILAAESIGYTAAPAYRYFHSYDNGDSRLMRYPKYIFDNAIRLYHMRNSALDRCGAALGFEPAELQRLRTDVAERLVRALFEAKGSLLVRGNAFEEMKGTVTALTEELYQTHVKDFSTVTRLKCFLLKKDWKIAIRTYACLREVYIRVKK